jgi:hypothetical protein
MKLTKLLILFLFFSLKGFSQQASSYTLKYDKTEFCAGLNSLEKPIIIDQDGKIITSKIFYSVYSYTNKSGIGKLIIDKDGIIDLSKSEIGIYSILFQRGSNSSTFIVNIKSCN